MGLKLECRPGPGFTNAITRNFLVSFTIILQLQERAIHETIYNTIARKFLVIFTRAMTPLVSR